MRWWWLGLAALGSSCSEVPWGDRLPPRLLATEVSADGTELALVFDEPVAEARGSVDDAPVPTEPGPSGRVPVRLPQGLAPGSGHVWRAEATDAHRNTLEVGGKFYAPNDHPAQLRLNEVRVAGTPSHTDFIELRVEAGGSLGGWTVEAWSAPGSRQRLVLPDAPVSPGDLVVVRYRPATDPVDTAAGALEYWPSDAKGLSPTKGLLCLRQQPTGPVVDALAYSKKPGESGDLITAAGAVVGEEHDPSGCTATRTWNRRDDGTWFIAATGGATPGAANKLMEWEGPRASRAGPPTTR